MSHGPWKEEKVKRLKKKRYQQREDDRPHGRQSRGEEREYDKKIWRAHDAVEEKPDVEGEMHEQEQQEEDVDDA